MISQIKQIIDKAVLDLYEIASDHDVTRPDAKFGDWSTNIALRISGKLGIQPRQIASEIAARICDDDFIVRAEVAGPGFINLWVSDAELIEQLNQSETDPLQTGKTVVIEYGDQNPLKPLHAGHLYTTLVGDAISRLVETSGARVVRINYGGDVGLHIGKSLWAVVKYLGGENPDGLADVDPEQRASWLGARYVEGSNAYEDDEMAKAEIVQFNKAVYSIHTENDTTSPLARIYWTIRGWSYDYFRELFRQLQIVPYDRFIPESEVFQAGYDAVISHPEVYTESQGAIVFEGDKYGLHTRVFVNSEGLPTYEAKDVGLLLGKWRDYGYDQSFIITGKEQSHYVDVMLKSVSLFEPEAAARTKHFGHGFIKLAGGIKMSSRKGNILAAFDILEAARGAARDSGHPESESMVLAAIKYAFLKDRISESDIVYDPRTSVALEGNSGPYLQYAHARAAGILRKVGDNAERRQPTSFDDQERLLVSKLGQFYEVLTQARGEYLPHLLCSYSYDLTQTFNRFYENSRVIGDERQPERLWLVDIYKQRLARCLELLGIEAPDSM